MSQTISLNNLLRNKVQNTYINTITSLRMPYMCAKSRTYIRRFISDSVLAKATYTMGAR